MLMLSFHCRRHAIRLPPRCRLSEFGAMFYARRRHTRRAMLPYVAPFRCYDYFHILPPLVD